jgi:Anti-sigma-K factor rskA
VKDGFDELVGGAELPAAERERLRRVHELLLTVGPPPEVAPELQAPPAAEPVRLLPRRRRTALALIAAAFGIAIFGTGYLVGHRTAEPTTERVLTMTGVGDVAAARGTIEILAQDGAGNWPMLVRVRGLEASADRDDFYELWLTRDGELAAPCGRFIVDGGVTEVTLSVPYGLRGFDGWVVTRGDSEELLLTT